MKSAHTRLKLVARFGAWRLLRDRSGLARISGNGEDSPAEVKEWIALFGHDLVLASPSRRKARRLHEAR